MSRSLRQFKQNVDSLRSLSLIYDYMNDNHLGEVMELDELLRTQHVLLVSAFDFYIHDVVRSGMLGSLEGSREKSKHFEKFSIPLKYVQLVATADSSEEKKAIIGEAIREVTQSDSCQSPQNVEKALNLIAIKKLWSSVAKEIDMKAEDVK